MIIPKGFYTIYQPKYQTPCLFDLNKRGMFKSRPPINDAPWGKLEKPDGGLWQDDDEIRECWMGYAGSEKEAERIFQALEIVLPEVKSQMA